MSPYTIAALLIGIVGSFLWFLRVKDHLGMNWAGALGSAVAHIVFGAVFAKIFGVIDFMSLDGFSAMRIYGPVFFLPFMYMIGARLFNKKLSVICDVFAISVQISLFAFRISCIINGCCDGKEISFLPGVNWPLRELEMLLYVVMTVIFAPKVMKKQTNGEVYPIFLIAYGVFRYAIEGFRYEYVTAFGKIHMAHIWSLISVVVGISVYGALKDKCGKNSNARRRKDD